MSIQVDNFDIVKTIMNFSSSGDFYFVQVVQRKKDGVIKRQYNVIKSYIIENIDQLYEKKAEMIVLCNIFKARLLLWINKRNYKKISYKLLEELVKKVTSENYNIKNLLTSVITSNASERRWIIDIDKDNMGIVDDVENFVSKIIPKDGKILAKVPSKNGIHLVTTPFNLIMFNKHYSDISVHRDNAINLYIV